MKKILWMLAIVLCLSTFAGCGESNVADIAEGTSAETEKREATVLPDNVYTDLEGVYMTLSSVSKTLITVEWHNETERPCLRGAEGNVKRYDAETDQWIGVGTGIIKVPAYAVEIIPGRVHSESFSFASFDVSQAGVYRFYKDFYCDGVKHTAWVEFEITE